MCCNSSQYGELMYIFPEPTFFTITRSCTPNRRSISLLVLVELIFNRVRVDQLHDSVSVLSTLRAIFSLRVLDTD